MVVVRTGLPSFIVTLAGLFILRGLTIGFTRLITGRTQVSGLKPLVEQDWLAPLFAGNVGYPVFAWLAANGWIVARTDGTPQVPGIPDVDRLVDRARRAGHLGAAAHPGRQLDLRRRRRRQRRAQCRRAGGRGEDRPVHVHRPAPPPCSPASRCSSAGSADVLRGTQKEFEAIIAAVIGGCLLTGGYGSAIGAAFGALIFGTVQQGIFYTGVDTDWFKVFLGAHAADRRAVQQLHPQEGDGRPLRWRRHR